MPQGKISTVVKLIAFNTALNVATVTGLAGYIQIRANRAADKREAQCEVIGEQFHGFVTLLDNLSDKPATPADQAKRDATVMSLHDGVDGNTDKCISVSR